MFTSPIHLAEGVKALVITLTATLVVSIFTTFVYLFVRLFKKNS